MGRLIPLELAKPPPSRSLTTLREAAARCRACPLWKLGSQTIFGEGPARARVVLVGEQPGDREDREGHPFVGPAGKLLDKALADAGIDRKLVYVTNAVKHFKWRPSPSGKRRLHEKPNAREIAACKPWLEAELQALEPKVVVALGATAAQGLLGRTFRVTQHRGELFAAPVGPQVMATIHPSSILRMDTDEERARETLRFTADLRRVVPFLK